MSRRLPIALLAAAALTAAAAPSANAASYPKLPDIRGDVKSSTSESSAIKLPDVLISGYQTGGSGE